MDLDVEACAQSRRCALRARSDLSPEALDRRLAMVDALTTFDLGRFLLVHRGLNGAWTHRIVTAPDRHHRSSVPLERFLFERAPTLRATQQRFRIFQQQLAALRDAGARSFASVPCGWLGDLLLLPEGPSQPQLFGVDLDEAALEGARQLAAKTGKADRVTFLQQDAWALSLPQPVDVITSNGLNLYEPDDARVTSLYRRFHEGLSPGGTLLMSFLTPPPAVDPASPWRLDCLDAADLEDQRLLFADVLEVTWASYRTESLTRRQLAEAGFGEVTVLWDDAALFPTVVARA